MCRFLLILLLYVNNTFAAFNPITTDTPPSEQSEEILLLRCLIAATEQNLVVQKELIKEIQAYQQWKQQYLKDMNNRTTAFEMVKHAQRAIKKINSNHLSGMFSSDFISELTFFSQIAGAEAS